MKKWRLILFLAAVLIPAASHGQALSISSYLSDISLLAEPYQIDINSRSIGSFVTNYSLSYGGSYVFGDVNSDTTLSGNVLSLSGNGDSYTSIAGPYAAVDSTIQLTVNIYSTTYFSIQASTTQPAYPSTNADCAYVTFGNNFFVGSQPYNSRFGPSSSAMSGILQGGQSYELYATSQMGGPASNINSVGGCHYEVILTLSPSNIVSTTVSGHITDAHSGIPITGATLQIGYVTAKSDSNGYYSQSNLPPATYTVIASANNYASLTNTVTTSSSQTNVTQNFALSPLPKLDYFGVGVDWQNVSDTDLNGVAGDVDATNLYKALQANLSSMFWQGSRIVVLDATLTSANNMNIISNQFNIFTNGINTNDTVVFYVSTHGGIIQPDYGYGPANIELGISDDLSHTLTAGSIGTMLESLANSIRKIVILDACHSGGVAEGLSTSVPNISILAACSDIGETECAPDGTGLLTDGLTNELYKSVFDLGRMANDIDFDTNYYGTFAALYGQNLALKDSGKAIFTGLQPQLWEGLGFTGNLTNNTVTIAQSPPKVLQPKVSNGSFQMTLTNVPSSGSIAIEVSTNLNSWLQVAFSPAAGTNLNYSFSVTNAPCQFFRTKVVP